MGQLRFLSKIEQVAAYLREQLASGKWHHELPGREELATELGVNAKTAEHAMHLLEREGLLIPQGAGRRRLIGTQAAARNTLRIKFLLYEKSDRLRFFHDELSHRLNHAGYVATIAEKSLLDLDMNLDRVARYVKSIETDAWVVASGPQDILEWFSLQPVPVYATFGRSDEIPISSVRIDRVSAMQSAVN